jgi:hypothetical protein
VTVSCSRRVGAAGSCPTVCYRIVSPTGVQNVIVTTTSSPDNHFTALPDCRVVVSALGGIGDAGSCPTVGYRIVSAAGVPIAMQDTQRRAWSGANRTRDEARGRGVGSS